MFQIIHEHERLAKIQEAALQKELEQQQAEAESVQQNSMLRDMARATGETLMRLGSQLSEYGKEGERRVSS